MTATVSHERGGDDNETQTDFGPAGAGFTYAHPGGGIRTLWSVQIPMMIRIVNSKEEIAKLSPKERVVHLAFPHTTITLLELMKRCPRLKAIEVPPSLFPKLSKPSLCLPEGQGGKVFPGRIWGHRTDIDEYYTVDDGLILQKAGGAPGRGGGLREDRGEGGGGDRSRAGFGGVHFWEITPKTFSWDMTPSLSRG